LIKNIVLLVCLLTRFLIIICLLIFNFEEDGVRVFEEGYL